MACEVLVELEIVAPQGNLSFAYFESEYLDLEQNPKLQQHALRRAGAIRIFTDYESGSKTQRPQLTECLNYLRENVFEPVLQGGQDMASPVSDDRQASSSAFHCATDTRYSSLASRVEALRRSSREIVDGCGPRLRDLTHANILCRGNR